MKKETYKIPPQQEKIYEQIKALLIKFGFSPKAITPNASFINDLGLDSLDYVEFIMEMEEALNISIPFEIIEQRCKTISDLTEIISELLIVKSKAISSSRHF